ncbi:hypothetical protein IWW39_003978 [Coemansia spiralis]|uniref:Uncharacterized protein n=1 Tax=Coemansia spiralis TaxID=417178 RepID=A0A9W8GI68_9FUNG|nr:hypothetical protein IWW39_003978 [Coemansia spiralis]
MIPCKKKAVYISFGRLAAHIRRVHLANIVKSFESIINESIIGEEILDISELASNKIYCLVLEDNPMATTAHFRLDDGTGLNEDDDEEEDGEEVTYVYV